MNESEENRRPSAPGEIRLFLESLSDRHIASAPPHECHRVRIDRYLGYRKYKTIRVMKPSYGSGQFLLPEDIPYICGYCIAVMEMDSELDEDDSKYIPPLKTRRPDGEASVFRYRIHVFGPPWRGRGRFEWSKHVDLDARREEPSE